MEIRRTLLTCLLLCCGLTGGPLLARAAGGQKPVATIRFILGGLTVQPPHQVARPARVNQQLFASYFLRTAAGQKASLAFADGSVLHINQRTDLVLSSSSLTVVQQGEVDQVVVKGTHHQVETAVAIAAALGTIFDVRITPKPSPSSYPVVHFPPGTATVSVVKGTVVVSNAYGSQRVLPNEWTHVRPGKAPPKPTHHNARADVAWASGLP